MNRSLLKKCPEDESFVRYFSGEFGEYEEDRFLEHAEKCPNCRLRLNVLASIQTELKAKEKDVPEVALPAKEERVFKRMAKEWARAYLKKNGASFSGMFRAGSLLAAGLLLLLLGYRFFVRISVPVPVMRGRAQVEIRLHRPEGKIKKAPKVFSWSKVKDSDHYHFDIVDDGLNLVFSTISYAPTRHYLPEDIRQKLERQKPYLWTVSAYDEEDQELGFGSGYFEIE